MDGRFLVLVGVVLAAGVGIFAWGPIGLLEGYYAFADDRTLLGIPNVLDVVSNLPFLVVGVLGLRQCRVDPPAPAVAAWRTFFASVSLVAFGSAWFHLSPDDDSVVWDRVPITIAFMALTAALLAEFVDARAQRWALVPALLVGVASVFVVRWTGDLRLYVWVQVAPMLALVVMLALYRSLYTRAGDLLWAFGAYVAAKLAELWDAAIYGSTGEMISGHTIKHLLAAGGLWVILRMLRRREPRG